MKSLETVTVETGPNPTFTILWMHGLGADGHDFEPLVPELLDDGMPAMRFVFPHAPVRPVTINNGYQMRAWYDIIGIDRRSAEDFEGIARVRRSDRRADPARECARRRQRCASRSPASRRVAPWRCTWRRGIPRNFAGIIALSCYLPGRASSTARAPANQATPIFMAHGTQDPVVPYAARRGIAPAARRRWLSVEWHAYPMPHSLCEPEVADLRSWLARVCGTRAA